MKWIETKNGLPSPDQTVLIEYFSGDYERKKYIEPDYWWRKNIKRWLDESNNEPVFTLQEMKEAFLAGANWGDGTSKEKPIEWFIRVYDIDITKS